MSTRSTAVLIGAAFAMIVGLGLKVHRYDRPPATDTALFEARLQQMLGSHDWQLSERRNPGETGEPYPKLTFHKAGCAKHLVVAVIGTTDGLAPYLVSKYGADVAFVQPGGVLSAPDLTRIQVEKGLRLFETLTGSPSPSQAPAIAVSPAPPAAPGPQPCRPPPVTYWEKVHTLELTQKTGLFIAH